MASTTAGKKKYGLPVKVAVVLLIFVQMTQAFCNPSLAGIMADFPEAPVTTVQTIINIATLVMIPAALVTGPIVNKIGYKTTGIIAMVIALVGGVAPAFVHPSVEFMIFERGVFGIGYGMVYTLSIAACGEFWRGKATTGVVGAVNFGAGLAGILYNLLAGALAPMGWEVIYYGYFIIVPIMVYYAIVMPQHSDLPKGEAAEGEKKAKVTLASFGTQFWLYIIGMALAIASAAAFMNNIAMIVVGTGIDATGAAVATVMTGFTVGMMIGGAAYPLLYGLLKRAAMAVYLLLDAVAFVVIMLYADFMVLMVMAVVIGIVFSGLNSAYGATWRTRRCATTRWRPPRARPSSLQARASRSYLCAVFPVRACRRGGTRAQENPFYEYYPAIAILAVGGVILLVTAIVKKNKVDYEREEPAFEGVEEGRPCEARKHKASTRSGAWTARGERAVQRRARSTRALEQGRFGRAVPSGRIRVQKTSGPEALTWKRSRNARTFCACCGTSDRTSCRTSRACCR